MNQSQLKVLTKIWGLFLFSPALFATLLHLRLSSNPAQTSGPWLPWPFQLAAGLVALLAFLLGRGGLQAENLRKAGTSTESISARWATTHLIVYVLAESVGLIGFVMGLLLHETSRAYPLMGLSAFLIGILYPDRATLEAALMKMPP